MKFMNSTERYKYDDEYRKRHLAKVAEKHEENSKYPIYLELHKVRNSICNWRNSIENHQAKIRIFRHRIQRAIIKKERLEIEWGMLRKKIKNDSRMALSNLQSKTKNQH